MSIHEDIEEIGKLRKDNPFFLHYKIEALALKWPINKKKELRVSKMHKKRTSSIVIYWVQLVVHLQMKSNGCQHIDLKM